MARPPKFSDDELLDGAARAFALHGHAVTIADIVEVVGAPSGSLYHRFESRDRMLALLWLRSVRRFHQGLLAAFATPEPRMAVTAAALHIPQFCRKHPEDALAMTLFRQPALATEGPADLRVEAQHVNDAIDAAQRDLVRRRYGRITTRRTDLIRIAVRLGPYGLVRPYLADGVPSWLDEVVVTSAAAIAALGD